MSEPPGQSRSAERDTPAPRNALAAALLRGADWFVPVSLREDLGARQRIHVFTVAHFVGVPLASIMVWFFYQDAPWADANLYWLIPLYLSFGVLPFIHKILPRLDIMGAISAQLFSFTVLISARYYGGLMSPALPWLIMSFGTAVYYLGPRRRWCTANVAVQLLQTAVFVFAALRFPPSTMAIPSEDLLRMMLASTFGVVMLMNVVTLHIWSTTLAKQRELDHEMTVRLAAQANQRLAETALLRSRDHLAQSQRVGKIGSAEVTLSPVYEARWSDALCDLFGREPGAAALDAEAFIELIHPDDRDFIRSRRDRERRGEYGSASEFRYMRPDGRVRWMRRQAEPIEWEHGRPKREIVIFSDITEQKEASDALVGLEEMLAQAHKMEAIGQLTGGVAHDFNNLLAVILGMLRLIEEELDLTVEANFDDMNEWLTTCIRAVNRGATLTKSMLAFSRRQALTPVVLDINAVIDDMIEMLSRVLGESYQLNVIKAPALWVTEVDAGQLQNALLNLLLNARDAVPTGGTLTVETRNSEINSQFVADHIDVSAGDYVELAVTDTGVGMTPEVLKRAFDPFFTTKETGKGSGLGLSMVYGFVKQSGGHVTIDSEAGHGTTVRIFLPRRENKLEVAAPAARPSSVAGTGGRVLVVEDNDDLRLITRRQIERLGYTVIDAADAAMGIDRLRTHPDTMLMVSDVVLPGVSGVELAEMALTEFPNLKIVFMSGHNEEHQAFDRIRDRMAIRLLQKPFQPGELAAQIRAVLN